MKLKRSVSPLALALALVSSHGCGLLPDESDEAELEDREYLLDSIEGHALVAGTTVRLSFRDDEVHFSAGCNSLFGEYALRDERLRVEGVGSTEKGCEPALHDQDEWLAAFMTSRPRLEQAGDQLTLTGEQATLVFLDREVADPDRPLVATPWTIDTFIKNDSASNYSLEPDPTILFDDDGSVRVDTSCNTAEGSYAVSASRITLRDLAYTEKACSGNSAAADAHIQEVLRDGTLTFEIEAARLTLSRGASGVSATAPRK